MSLPLGKLQTPPADIAALGRFRARCEALGIPAITVDDEGEVIGCCGDAGVVAAFRPRLLAAGAGHAEPAGLAVEFLPGAWALLVSHRSGRRTIARSAALVLSPRATSEGELARACAEAVRSGPGALAALERIAHFDHASARTTASLLQHAADDTAARTHDAAAIEGFTLQLSESYDTIDLLYSVGRSMKQLAQPRLFIKDVCERLQRTMNFAWIAMVFAPDERLPNWFRGMSLAAGEAPMPPHRLAAAAGSLLDRAVAERVVCITSNHPLATGPGGQVLAQPLLCKGEVCGVLIAGGKTGADPHVSSYDSQLIEAAAGHVDAFTSNYALLEDQRLLFMGTVQAITAAIDAKDRYTFGHSERVAYMSEQLALRIGLDAERAERLRIAGLVHDVGKIGVPEAVLCKPGRLTEDEFDKIKLHPEIGHRILKDIPQLADVLPGVLHHHERFDGKGYPHGLKGEQTPLIARIIAVADTFDAMSSNRSYRPALSREKVLAEIARCAGTQHDPEIAQALLRMDLSEFDAMVARHARVLVQAA